MPHLWHAVPKENNVDLKSEDEEGKRVDVPEVEALQTVECIGCRDAWELAQRPAPAQAALSL